VRAPNAALACAPSLVRKLRREPTVDADTAFAFLGIGRDLGFRLARAYRVRLAKTKHVLDSETIKPRRDAKTGAWKEVPSYMIGGRLRCRSDLLLWMMYPEGRS
jgi:hypothetical protein